MYQGHRIGAVLLMGGKGERFGSEIPKQFLRLGGRRIYQHALQVFLDTGYCDEIVLVCHSAWLDLVREEVLCGVRLVAGGGTRQESSWAGLRGFETLPEIVMLHDAVRPFVNAQIVRDNLEACLVYGAVDTCIASTDTLVWAPEGKTVASIPQRREWLRGQTPQTFRYDWIVEAHAQAERAGVREASDDCQLLLSMGRAVGIVQGSERNIKITTSSDLAIAGLVMDGERA